MIKKIIAKTTLDKILELKGAEEILAKHNLPCLNCPFAQAEMKQLQIGQVSQAYGINLEKLLKDLNKIIK